MNMRVTGYKPIIPLHTLVETRTRVYPWAMGAGKWWVRVRVSSWIPTSHPCHCLAPSAETPSFAGLQHFPQGHGFKQWTGDDSKALMIISIKSVILLHIFQVDLHAIEGHVPVEIVRTSHSFLLPRPPKYHHREDTG